MRPRRGSLVRLTRLHGLVGELVEAKGADSARIWLRAGQPAPITLLASGSDADLDRFEDAFEELLDAEHAPRRARLLAALAARSLEQEPAHCPRPSRRSLMPRASAIPSTTRPSSRIRRQSRNSPDGSWSSGTTTTRRICPASRNIAALRGQLHSNRRPEGPSVAGAGRAWHRSVFAGCRVPGWYYVEQA